VGETYSTHGKDKNCVQHTEIYSEYLKGGHNLGVQALIRV
jgi:hypothetical protein